VTDWLQLRIHLGYAEKLDEINILRRQRQSHPIDAIEQVITAEQLLDLQERIKNIFVDELIEDYIVSLVTATRHHEDVYLGASARGSLALYRTSQARAAISGRDYVIPDDVKLLAEPVLGHRLIISPAARIRNVTAPTVMSDILNAVPVPGARAGRRYERDSAVTR
jgi:MoxR-like ATPase